MNKVYNCMLMSKTKKNYYINFSGKGDTISWGAIFLGLLFPAGGNTPDYFSSFPRDVLMDTLSKYLICNVYKPGKKNWWFVILPWPPYEIGELQKGAKHPPCSSDFINKTERKSNTEFPNLNSYNRLGSQTDLFHTEFNYKVGSLKYTLHINTHISWNCPDRIYILVLLISCVHLLYIEPKCIK